MRENYERLRVRRSRGVTASHVLAFLVLSVAACAAFFPFLYVVSASFKESAALMTYPPRWIPWPPYLGNYAAILTTTDFPRWFFNSVLVATCVTLLKLVFDSMAGYAFAKMSFPLKEPLFLGAIALMMIPLTATLIPMFQLVHFLGLINTYPGLMLPGLASPLGIFLMRQFIEQLPTDLENAARLDGASEMYILGRIVVPLVKPGLVTLAIWLFLSQWVAFAWPLVATTTDDMRLLTNGMATLQGQYTVNWGMIAAGSVLVLAPMIVAFLLFTRQFVAGSLAGALKQ